MSVTVEYPIIDMLDEVEISGTSGYVNNSPSLGIGNSGTTRSFGLRFRISPGIPRRATILSARVRFRSTTNTADDTVNATISLEDNTAASRITSYSDYWGRPLVPGPLAWNIGIWQSGASTYDTPDFSASFQHLVDRPDWTSTFRFSNVFVRDNNSATNAFRTARAFGGGSHPDAPILRITYNPYFNHLDYQDGQFKEVGENSGHYLVRNSAGDITRIAGSETIGALIIENGIIKERR